MQKEDLTILIVDDDVTLGKAMSQAVTRAGYKALHFTKPDEALTAIKLQSIHAAVIDCMLPRMNGRDLARKIRDEGHADIPIFLISGIYKDKAFTREAIQATGAISFLTKPFEIEDFLAEIETGIKHLLDVPVAPLNALVLKTTLSYKERIRAVNESDTVSAFDLPWVYSLLLHPKINGHLNIISAEGDVSGVGFHAGQIVQVNQEDARSYFGVLMVEYGFITQAELDAVIKSSGKTKKLGERLVESNVLSPHAIQIVMADQQGIRLSKTIGATQVKINFIETDEIRVNAPTDRLALTDLLNEWLASKISTDWLSAYYMPWMRYNVKKGQDFNLHHRVFSIPVVQRVPNLIDLLLRKDTLEGAMDSVTEPPDHFYRALHALLVSRIIHFGEAAAITDYTAQKTRIEKLNSTLEQQNHFERLGLNSFSKEADIKRAYHELAKVIHPDKLPPDAPEEIRTLARSAFEKISTAHSILTDSKKKADYVLELQRGHADAQMEAEQYAEQARPLLSTGDMRQARELLEKAIALAPPSSDTRLMMMWARLKAPNAEKDLRLVSAMKDEFAKVPPEDRHNVMYYFVKGLLLRATGDTEGARKSFENIIAQSPDFIDARRELSTLQAAKDAGKINILTGDLKDVVGLFFKKRK